MSTLFFTGFPGFLGSELVPRVLGRSADDVALCLVQPKFVAEIARVPTHGGLNGERMATESFALGVARERLPRPVAGHLHRAD